MDEEISKGIRTLIGPKKACYVLITCDEPGQGGEMEVQLNYEGDPILAAYLLDNARAYVDEQIDEMDGTFHPEPRVVS